MIVYIAGPYRADTDWEVRQNIQKAEEAAARLWARGYIVICPHKNSAFMSGVCDESCFMQGYLKIMGLCDFVVMLEGWENSAGCIAEYKEAKRLNMNVFKWENGKTVKLE